jgi:hypothetical protein
LHSINTTNSIIIIIIMASDGGFVVDNWSEPIDDINSSIGLSYIACFALSTAFALIIGLPASFLCCACSLRTDHVKIVAFVLFGGIGLTVWGWAVPGSQGFEGFLQIIAGALLLIVALVVFMARKCAQTTSQEDDQQQQALPAASSAPNETPSVLDDYDDNSNKNNKNNNTGMFQWVQKGDPTDPNHDEKQQQQQKRCDCGTKQSERNAQDPSTVPWVVFKDSWEKHVTIPSVRYPWGCAEYMHQTKHHVAFDFFVQRQLGESVATYSKEWENNCTRGFRDDLMSKKVTILDNPSWRCMPSMTFVEGQGPRLCCCRYHSSK